MNHCELLTRMLYTTRTLHTLHAHHTNALTKSLIQLHVAVAAQRVSGDPAAIHPFLAEIGKDRRKSSEGEIDTGAAALHLAVRCASGELRLASLGAETYRH